jgi:hypothetical protein
VQRIFTVPYMNGPLPYGTPCTERMVVDLKVTTIRFKTDGILESFAEMSWQEPRVKYFTDLLFDGPSHWHSTRGSL